MHIGTDAVHADEFARHKETRYLIAAVLTGDGCFEEARTDGKERGKGSAGTEQVFAFFRRRLWRMTASSWLNSLGSSPTGRQSSRKEQEEHSVFI
ncbi:Uncharacterised protein [Neisseria gonorrhoeae]|uniref:Uncharacterized protein n=1 Tax=Neisseria gonorrhoeae TaxID=485 RepID=A0A378VSJ8_NEIGO|nr:Uncharacterised protein [Neisseria gonorrhoeae]